MNKFKPHLLLDEQMIFHDTNNTLLYQVREELKIMNQNLAKLNKPPEPPIETNPPKKSKKLLNQKEG